MSSNHSNSNGIAVPPAGAEPKIMMDDSEVMSNNTNLDDSGHARHAATLEEERQKLAAREDEAVKWLRVAVFGVLLVTAVLACAGVFLYMRNDQTTDFEAAFAANAHIVIESFHKSVERQLESLDSLSVAYTSFAVTTNATFPNVTLPSFEMLGANARILGSTPVVNFYPLVTDETRLGWEEYARRTRGHYRVCRDADEEQRYVQDEAMNLTYDDKAKGFDDGANISDTIRGLDWTDFEVRERPYGQGRYLPIWQMSPAIPFDSFLMFDLLTHPAGMMAYNMTVNTGQAVLEAASNLNGENLAQTGVGYQMTLATGQFRTQFDKFIGDPTSSVGYPVFDSFDVATRKVVGILATNMYWIIYLRNVLPATARGIICVVENNLGQNYSYRIDGPDAVYLGDGDHHDPRFDSLEVSADVTNYLQAKKGPQTRAYSSVDLNGDYCRYTLRVYPSEDTRNEFVNQLPVLMLMVVAMVFLFTSAVFLVYLYMEKRRHRIIMDRALASGAIVSSLFPSTVRDQLYNETTKRNRQSTVTTTTTAGDNYWKNNRESNRNDGENGGIQGGTDNLTTQQHIAQVYDPTTIMFADLAGFTKWSSSRQPSQVFELLEALYKEFDKMAAKRKVFKVETIGDCYVAVTGIPHAQEDHAVIMARFVNSCLHKMSEITHDLVPALGPDTANLQLRAGLHSGSVTGGVLRGDKSRFQLFGDTMNTASRMESNGLPGRIQVSQETADCLIARGKGTWLKAREDKIQAKGKGELQTYWLAVKAAGSTISQATTTMTTDLVVDGNGGGGVDGGNNNNEPSTASSAFFDEVKDC